MKIYEVNMTAVLLLVFVRLKSSGTDGLEEQRD